MKEKISKSIPSHPCKSCGKKISKYADYCSVKCSKKKSPKKDKQTNLCEDWAFPQVQTKLKLGQS